MLEMNFFVRRPRISKPGTVKIRDRKKDRGEEGLSKATGRHVSWVSKEAGIRRQSLRSR